MGGVFGGSKSKSKSSSNQTVVPWAQQQGQANLALANRLADPFLQGAPTQRVAGFTNDQLGGFDTVRNYAAQGSQLSADALGNSNYRSLSQQGPHSMGAVGGVPTMQAANIAPAQNVAAQKFTDSNIDDYMNPYANQVVDASLADLDQNYKRSMNQSGLLQAAGGAFGGGRHAIREAQVVDDYLRNVGSTSSQLRNQAFNSAAGLIQSDQNRALQASQSNQQAGLQRAIQQAQFEQQENQANMAGTMEGRKLDLDSKYRNDDLKLAAIQGAANANAEAQRIADQRTLQNAELLSMIGGQQQQQKQVELDVPFNVAEWKSNILAKTPFPTLTNSKSKSSAVSFNAKFPG